MKCMIAYIKLPLIHCYHIFSNSTDVYLAKNYHEHYSLIRYRPTMLAHGLLPMFPISTCIELNKELFNDFTKYNYR